MSKWRGSGQKVVSNCVPLLIPAFKFAMAMGRVEKTIVLTPAQLLAECDQHVYGAGRRIRGSAPPPKHRRDSVAR